jgi:hypothetical protein
MLRYCSRSFNFSVIKKIAFSVRFIRRLIAFLTLNPLKWFAFFYNDRRFVAVRYGALENSDKNGLPIALKNVLI